MKNLHKPIHLAASLLAADTLLFCATGCQETAVSRLPPSTARPYTLLEIDEQKRQGLCALHHEALREDAVPIVYGLPDEHYMNAKYSRFPHADSFVFGGCLVGEPKVVRVQYCQECRLAEDAWKTAWYSGR